MAATADRWLERDGLDLFIVPLASDARLHTTTYPAIGAQAGRECQPGIGAGQFGLRGEHSGYPV
ncbi:hypothetical protein D3C76_1793630 [compost metagenome]